MVGIIATMVQLFFAWRVKVLTNKMWIVILIVVTAFGSICEYFVLPDLKNQD